MAQSFVRVYIESGATGKSAFYENSMMEAIVHDSR